MELDAYLYEEVAKEDPACIERLKRYIAEGKAGVDGGTYGQPFGQDYGWEPNIRQLTFGRQSLLDTLGADIKAFLVEEQWFHPQLPQLLLQSGFKYASLQNQNSGQVMPMNESMINWRGIDGSVIPAVPANDLQVSCVRQYTDYSAYAERLGGYERPLLFQWVEIWPPGMDWGASALPFKEAIQQVLEWGGRPVTLGDYFEAEADRTDLKDIYIPLDASNYANNWYQGGGWGYDGDRILQADKRAERALLAWETLAAWNAVRSGGNVDEALWEREWKEIMVLQNHDYSVARSYRAVTEQGIVTNAGSYGVIAYDAMTSRNMQRAGELAAGKNKPMIVNPIGVAYRRTVELPDGVMAAREGEMLRINGASVPTQKVKRGGRDKWITVIELPAYGEAGFDTVPQAGDAAASDEVQRWETGFEDERYRVEWVKPRWDVWITDKQQQVSWTVKGFTGSIGKVNEHDGAMFHALSPGHEQFAFAFDGTTHAPDQLAWVTASVEESGPVRTTLCLRSDLVTLHTTNTPVAFAEARISVDHVTGRIEIRNHLNAGVYLNVQNWMELAYDIAGAEVYRDFPFGEEKTDIRDLYPNTYTRVSNGSQGFTLVHTGTQRMKLERTAEGGTIRHLQARDRVHGDYEWIFTLVPGCHEPWESAQLAQVLTTEPVFAALNAAAAQEQLQAPHASGNQPGIAGFTSSDARLIPSALYMKDGQLFLRIVNYSPDAVQEAALSLRHPFTKAAVTNMEGCLVQSVALRSDAESVMWNQSFNPWQIVTIALS